MELSTTEILIGAVGIIIAYSILFITLTLYMFRTALKHVRNQEFLIKAQSPAEYEDYKDVFGKKVNEVDNSSPIVEEEEEEEETKVPFLNVSTEEFFNRNNIKTK